MSDPRLTDVPGDEIPLVREPVEHEPITAQPDRVGPYQILQVLGEGGMGVVYLAEQKQPVRRRVALKLIKLGMDTKEVIARFESERQALAMMSHPHVAAVLDAGATEHGRPYFVMEYVPGIPITEYCDKHRLGIPQRLELFVHVCEAVQHAHQKGIIHRDIKPSNVLVMMQDGRPLPKVIDFGVAKATAGRLTERTVFTEQGRIIGTPAYMSPEQAEMSG
ncbi:MAG: serine/threonine protein kinase [Planctomycetes bacterium]|nr:serine/threonine protein kinase [Planctomycetota bacterium]